MRLKRKVMQFKLGLKLISWFSQSQIPNQAFSAPFPQRAVEKKEKKDKKEK